MATEKMASAVELGFVKESLKVYRLQSRYFPSKIGGKPAWLELNSLPRSEVLQCPQCKQPMVHLIQVYAPLNDNDTCFHRTIFLFLCKNAQCHAKGNADVFKVFRSQLPRANACYSFEPPSDDESCSEDSGSDTALTKESTASTSTEAEIVNKVSRVVGDPLCVVCGCFGSKCCSQCKKPQYCSREHQRLHWQKGHKRECQQDVEVAAASDSVQLATKSLLLPEMEIITDAEPEEEQQADTLQAEVARQQEFNDFVRRHGNAGSLGDSVEASELSEAAGIGIEDKQFKTFKKRVAAAPDQVLRYDRGGQPLWVCTDNQPLPDSIPPCLLCGGPRVFEFQVLPQLLNHLGLDDANFPSVDWATLAVFTCQASCSSGSNYKEEFLWKQDF